MNNLGKIVKLVVERPDGKTLEINLTAEIPRQGHGLILAFKDNPISLRASNLDILVSEAHNTNGSRTFSYPYRS